MRLGKRIRDMRRLLGMTQAQLASKLEVSRKTVVVYEHGDVTSVLESADFWIKLAAAFSRKDFEVTVAMLLADLLPPA